MEKQCTRIEIESDSGYFCHPHKTYKLVITKDKFVISVL